MKSRDLNRFNIGPALTLTFVVLVGLIVGGNGLLLWQFERARLQTELLTGENQQVVAILRLQEVLLVFNQRLNELVNSQHADRFINEAEPLRRILLDQINETRDTLAHLPAQTLVDPAFQPTLDAIEIDLTAQVDVLTALAKTGDWEVMHLRLANEMEILGIQISSLVKGIDQESSKELISALASMRNMQQRIILLVPVLAIFTSCIAGFFGWAISRRIVELRLEARVAERMRIARDLHDTLLQSFQGVLLKFYAATYKVADEGARADLERVIEQARSAIAEGRDAVQGLRSSATVTNDLARAIGQVGQELAAHDNGPHFDLQVVGEPRELVPIVRDEAYRIGCEALRNAFLHAQARQIEVEIQYEPRRLQMRVRDNGKGIDPKLLKEGGRAGHHGIPGMHERAKLVGGKLAVWSEVDSGAEVELTIPGSVAYSPKSHG